MNHIGDTNKMVGDTPRTDACLEYDDTTVDDVKDFARQLERELNAANDRIKRLEGELESTKADRDSWSNQSDEFATTAADLIIRINRLEEAGDEIEMILLQYASRAELPRTMAIEQSDLSKRLCVNWRKAKEAKL